jgi:tRNA threonylcarbamoyladenosine biosynthesis protein TsaB
LKLLAFDTSTEFLSIAVTRDGRLWRHEGRGGAAASAALIPAIQQLLAQAELRLSELEAIVFGHGPGSFTGLRTACSVAQGLAFGASVPVLGVDTLLAVAETAREQAGCTEVLAVLDARMDEVYAGHYQYAAGAWQRRREFSLGPPQALVLPAGWTLAGNAAPTYGDRLPPGPRVAAMPQASALLRLAPALLAQERAVPADRALPLYIRDKVAQTTAERAARRAEEIPRP